VLLLKTRASVVLAQGLELGPFACELRVLSSCELELGMLPGVKRYPGVIRNVRAIAWISEILAKATCRSLPARPPCARLCRRVCAPVLHARGPDRVPIARSDLGITPSRFYVQVAPPSRASTPVDQPTECDKRGADADYVGARG
jgi:hypothetical protein